MQHTDANPNNTLENVRTKPFNRLNNIVCGKLRVDGWLDG